VLQILPTNPHSESERYGRLAWQPRDSPEVGRRDEQVRIQDFFGQRQKRPIRSHVMKLRSFVPCSRGNTWSGDSPIWTSETYSKTPHTWKTSPITAGKAPRSHGTFNLCHAHWLIAKIPHSRRWRLTKQGRIAMTASIQLRDVQFSITHMKLTASC